MKSVQFLSALLLLVAPPVIFADKPDPELPNPPIQVWIAGGEVLDADVSGSTVDANIINTPERIPWSETWSKATNGEDYVNFWLMDYPDDFPEGTILVIESFSYSAPLPPGVKVSVRLTTTGGGELGVFRWRMPIATGITLDGLDVYQDSASMRAYAGGTGETGDSVNVAFSMTAAVTNYEVSVSLSGYFVPEDSPSLAP
jgi:hypothetical protein